MSTPIMIHGDNFAFFTTIEEQKVFELGNWWYITSKNCAHKVHFLDKNLNPICGKTDIGNCLIPDIPDATNGMSFWDKGKRCKRCEEILESRKKKAREDTMKALRKSGFQVGLTDVDYMTNDGYLPLFVVVDAPIKGLAKEEADE